MVQALRGPFKQRGGFAQKILALFCRGHAFLSPLVSVIDRIEVICRSSNRRLSNHGQSIGHPSQNLVGICRPITEADETLI